MYAAGGLSFSLFYSSYNYRKFDKASGYEKVNAFSLKLGSTKKVGGTVFCDKC